MKKKAGLIVVCVLIVALTMLSLCGCSIEKEQNQYDAVLASGGGYNIVLKIEDGHDTVGVIDDNGKWVQPLSAEHPFIKDGKVMRYFDFVLVDLSGKNYSDAERAERDEKSRIDSIKRAIEYDGGGVFYLQYAHDLGGTGLYIRYNAKTGGAEDIRERRLPNKKRYGFGTDIGF